MQTGKNAGAYACGVTWGFHTKEHLLDEGADFIAETPNELIDIINKINKEKSK
jgi:phosphoglycolate phosphatase